MKKLLIFGIFMLFATSAFASGTFGVGVSTNKHIENVGVSLLTGVQVLVDSTRQMYLRTEFTKVNWGNGAGAALDNIGVKYITYWDIPVWNKPGQEFKFGLHFSGDYRTATGGVDAAFGGELYKNLWNKTLGIYLSGDFINSFDPQSQVTEYFVASLGFVIGNF